MLELLQNGATYLEQRTKINEAVSELNKSISVVALADWTADGPSIELEPNTVNTLNITTDITSWTITLSEDGTCMIIISKSSYTMSTPAGGPNVYMLTDKGTEDISEDLVILTITRAGSRYIYSFAALVNIPAA